MLLPLHLDLHPTIRVLLWLVSMLKLWVLHITVPHVTTLSPPIGWAGLAFPPNAVVAMLSYRSTGDFRPSKSPSTERAKILGGRQRPPNSIPKRKSSIVYGSIF